MRTVDPSKLASAARELGDAVLDPGIWPRILDRISDAAGATGAALVQSDIRTPDIPRTASVDDCFKHYFAAGWHMHDTRAERGLPLLTRGKTVITDQDLVTPEEMQRLEFYNECALPLGVPWFAGIGLRAGPALWLLVILRAARQGPFTPHEVRVLAELAPRLSETATLSKAVGQAILCGISGALQMVSQPALVLDRLGFVIDCNAGAEQIFDDDVCLRNRRLMVRDQRASSALNAFMDQMQATPDTAALTAAPIVVRRTARRPLVIHFLPINGAVRSPFLGARALLTLSEIETKPAPSADLLCEAFGLTRAEADVAVLVAQGKSLAAIAEQRRISPITARNQIKAIFAKTGTHRQGELVALLSRFG
jgi:DNA-binding CsgD family transcriptional regulator